jgi:hypothetical protein
MPSAYALLPRDEAGREAIRVGARDAGRTLVACLLASVEAVAEARGITTGAAVQAPPPPLNVPPAVELDAHGNPIVDAVFEEESR